MSTTTTDRRLGLTGNVPIKRPCKAATTANITLSGAQTIDGISVTDGDRVLVWNQTTGSQNGVYDASTGTWTRSIDFDGSYDAVQGTLVFVNQGTLYAGSFFQIQTADTFVIGTDSLTFAQVGPTVGSFTSLTISSNVNIGGTLTSSGTVTTSSGLTVSGTATLSSALNATGVATFSSSSTFSKSINASSALNVTGYLTASASAIFSGAVTMSSALNVSGLATLSSSLVVTGGVSLSSGLTVANTLTASTGVSLINGSSAPANGSSNYGVRLTGTAGFGVYVGSSAPTLSAAQGSLYLRTEGGTSLTRAYINTAGTSVWTAILTNS